MNYVYIFLLIKQYLSRNRKVLSQLFCLSMGFWYTFYNFYYVIFFINTLITVSNKLRTVHYKVGN